MGAYKITMPTNPKTIKDWEKDFDREFPLFIEPAFSGEIRNRWLKKKKELKALKSFIRTQIQKAKQKEGQKWYEIGWEESKKVNKLILRAKFKKVLDRLFQKWVVEIPYPDPITQQEQLTKALKEI